MLSVLAGGGNIYLNASATVQVGVYIGIGAPDITVTFSGPSSGASGSAPSAVSNSTGVATTTMTANNIDGTWYLHCDCIYGSADVQFTNIAPPRHPATLSKIAGDPGVAQPGATFAPNPKVQVLDQFGAVMGSAIALVWSALPDGVSGAGCTVNGGPNVTVTTDSFGQSEVTCVANGIEGAYFVQVRTVADSSVVASFSMQNATAPPAPTYTAMFTEF